MGMLDGNPPSLVAPPFGRPIDEPLHLIAVFPGKVKEFARVQAGGFRPEKGFKPPPQIRTIPRIQAISPRNNPVVPQHFEHCRTQASPPVPPSMFTRTSLPAGLRGARAREASLHRASPRFRCNARRFRSPSHLSFFPRNAWRRLSRPRCRAG